MREQLMRQVRFLHENLLQEGKNRKVACISGDKCFAAVFSGLPLRCYVDGLP
jgi:hypothetical protein